MSDEDRFRFELGKDEPETAFEEEVLQQRLSALSRRLSFLMLALPLLLALALYVAYRDLAQQTAKIQSAELITAQNLAAAAEQKMATLASRLAEFESSFTATLESERRNLQRLQETLSKGAGEVDKLLAAKAEKKDLSEVTARVDAALASIQKEIQTHGRELQALAPFREELGSATALRSDIASVSGRLQRLENMLGKDLTGMAGYLERTKNDLEKLKTDLANLNARKIDRETLELENLKTKRLYQMALDQEVSRIDKTITGVQRRLDQLERAFGVRSGSPAPLPPLTGGIREQAVE